MSASSSSAKDGALGDERRELEAFILRHFVAHSTIADSRDFLASTPFSHVDPALLNSTLQSLQSISYVALTPIEHSGFVLTEEGAGYARNGTPEGQLFRLLSSAGGALPLKEAEAAQGKEAFEIARGKAMRDKWVVLDKATGALRLKDGMDFKDTVQDALQQVGAGKAGAVDPKLLADLRKRKLIALSTERSFAVAKGAEWSEERRAQLTDLTAEVLRSREWASASVKQYNWSVKGVAPGSGSLHPLMKVRHQVRSILLEMGFEEMPTNNYVESSFWNFDALFQPQQHPARDSHDTFFLRSPARCRLLPEEYLARVKAMHERGGEGSIGYRYDWKREEAEKNILRTHTTAVSSRMLYALAGQSPFVPRKYFSIDRVFRNETLDATHLAEFHQVEGLIADRHLSLGDLLGTIEYFFRRIGISDVKFKPAYNPYTEPSMEIFGYSPQLGKWIEVGNSGMFRPEMLRPMGLPEDVRVIAWGLGLERPTMIKYGIRNIRDLFGPKVKLDVIQSQPIARFDD